MVIIDSLPDSLSDNRDDDVIVNCETSGGAPFERYIRVGPKPGVRVILPRMMSANK